MKTIVNNSFKLVWNNESIDIISIKSDIIDFNKKDYLSNLTNIFFEKINQKVSVIITLYNQVKFIPKIYSCILNQSFRDLEIIFIDDNSEDNPLNILEEMMKKDKRIIYIKNLVNKGQFYSRNKAALFSKGEYILIIDPDDFLLNNIIEKSYMTAKKYNLDIVHFHHMVGNITNNSLFIKNISGIFYQPQIKNIFFILQDRYLWDKLIKRNIFIKSIYFMKKKFRKERFSIHNDDVACFGIYKIASSYGFLEQIGYFYNRGNENSTHNQNFKRKNINGRYRSLFSIMKYYYEQTDNNTYEKIMGGYNFYKLRLNKRYRRKIKYLTKGFGFIIDVLDLYIKSRYYNIEQKKNLKNLKNLINKQKSRIINNKKLKIFL